MVRMLGQDKEDQKTNGLCLTHEVNTKCDMTTGYVAKKGISA